MGIKRVVFSKVQTFFTCDDEVERHTWKWRCSVRDAVLSFFAQRIFY
jgi:hypothetical protein